MLGRFFRQPRGADASTRMFDPLRGRYPRIAFFPRVGTRGYCYSTRFGVGRIRSFAVAGVPVSLMRGGTGNRIPFRSDEPLIAGASSPPF